MRYLLFISLALVLVVSWSGCAQARGSSLDDELAYRVQFSQASDVALLLRKGADPNALSKTGLPMVSVATQRKDDEAISILRVLVKGGADVNRGGVNNQYPVNHALPDS
jgi:hypothetical protein